LFRSTQLISNENTRSNIPLCSPILGSVHYREIGLLHEAGKTTGVLVLMPGINPFSMAVSGGIPASRHS
jgi:hypothetical protein